MVDNGAYLSCTGSQAWHILKKYLIRLLKLKNQLINLADDRPQTVHGTNEIPLSVNNVCKIIKFSVFPTLKGGLLLSSDFCRKFALIVDFNNNSWKIHMHATM